MAHTFVNDLFGKAPKRRVLKGDKRNPESGSHVIEFPGGAVELTRLDDDSYWAHIIINRGQALPCCDGLEGARGVVVESRINWDERRVEAIPGLPEGANLTQLAVRIMPQFPAHQELAA